MLTVKSMLEAANGSVPRISVDEAQAMVANRDALLLDVRDGAELTASGKAAGALHVSRGMLEFRADPASPNHDPQLRKDRPVILYCAAGGRAALSGKLLQDMGYTQVFNLGGFDAWVQGGGAVEP